MLGKLKDKVYLVFRLMALILFTTPVSLMSQQTSISTVYAQTGGAVTQRNISPVAAAAPATTHTDSLPLCPTGKEYDAGLCYPKCKEGYYGIGPVCWQNCPDGYINDGALCRKDAIITSKPSYGRGAGTPLTCDSTEDKDGALCYPKCQSGYYGVGPVCWQTCPDGYINDGLTCRLDADIFTKDSYGRGIATLPPCGDKENVAGLCYPYCAAGYYGVGPVCWQYCPDGYINDGVTCRRDAVIFAKANYGRGAGVVLHACDPGSEQSGGLCYPVCAPGFSGIGPVCWGECPSGSISDGATCRIDAIIVPKDSYGRGVGAVPDCDINNLDCAGNFEVSNNFRPKPWGYHFDNWGKDYDDSTDFDTATLLRMFGPTICQTGTTASDCVLKASMRDWRDGWLKSAKGGHCYGLAVTSQMFYAKLDKPAVYFSTAANTFDMDASASVRGHITEMFATQALTQVGSLSNGYLGSGQKPSEILQLIRTNLQDAPADPYVLAIFKTDDNGKITGGHAVTPFAIENRGSGIYWVHIYDNNWSNTDRYIVFDTTNDTWLYGFGSTNPAEPADAWKGDAKTATLELRPTSAHKLGGWYCASCGTTALVGATKAANEAPIATSVQFDLSGGGDLLVSDAQQHSVGWDATTKKYLDEITGASRQFIVAGAGVAVGNLIRVPVQTPSDSYTVSVSGDGLTQTAMVHLAMIGPGYTLDVDDVALAPTMHLTMTFRTDGRQVTFNADAAGSFTPTIKLANDLSASGNGYLFGVSGITLTPSKTVTVSLDTDQNALHFSDNTEQTNAYKIEVLRITPQGQDQPFMNDSVVVTGGVESALNFGNWDGSGAMSFVLGSQTQMVDNQAKVQLQLYLPRLLKK